MLLLVFSLVGVALWALISIGLVGIIIGGLARLIIPNRQNVGILATILLGWLGSVVGGFIGYHILGTGRLVTILLEIAIAAAFIGFYSASRGKQVAGGTTHPLPRQ